MTRFELGCIVLCEKAGVRAGTVVTYLPFVLNAQGRDIPMLGWALMRCLESDLVKGAKDRAPPFMGYLYVECCSDK